MWVRGIVGLLSALGVVLIPTGCGGRLESHNDPPTAKAAPLPAVVTVYTGLVRASGQVSVSFAAGRPGRCGSQCDVTGGQVTWNVPPDGGIDVFDLGPRARPRLSVSFDLFGPLGKFTAANTSVHHGGNGTCVDSTGVRDAALPVTDDGHGRLRFGLDATLGPLPAIGPETPSSIGLSFFDAGLQPDLPPPTSCGGPLPADVLPSLPSRDVGLARLRHRGATVDLSGSGSFSAHGLVGSTRSTIVLHVSRLRAQRLRTRPGRTRMPLSAADRVLLVHYRVVKVAGSVSVATKSSPSSCTPFDVCGLSGTITVRPDVVDGQAALIAYDSAQANPAGLRRAAGLARGRVPVTAQAYGEASWSGAAGSVSSALAGAGNPGCRDSAPLPVGGIGLDVNGSRVTAVYGTEGSGLPGIKPPSIVTSRICTTEHG